MDALRAQLRRSHFALLEKDRSLAIQDGTTMSLVPLERIAVNHGFFGTSSFGFSWDGKFPFGKEALYETTAEAVLYFWSDMDRFILDNCQRRHFVCRSMV